MGTHRTFAALGVRFSGLCDPLRRALAKLEVQELNAGLLLTSGQDGEHDSCGSLHFQGRAIDFRVYAIRHLGRTAEVVPVTDEDIRAVAPATSFDLAGGPEVGYWHLEFDPK
jgi:hypothetical protein